MKLTDRQIYDRFANIKALPTCSQWAAGFSDSIRQQIDKGRSLTDRQKDVCYKILAENSPEEVKKLGNWAEEYKTHHRQKAVMIATYYRAQATGYYGDVVTDILGEKVPNRTKYLKMINNKYAKKVITEYNRPARFTIEDQIIPNSKFIINYGYTIAMMESTPVGKVTKEERDNFRRRGGIIVGIDDKIKSAAKGAKRYKVLPFGSMKTYYVEERYLKKKPQPKKGKK